MDTGNIDQPAICKECGVTTTLDSVQQICWECWTKISEHMDDLEDYHGKMTMKEPLDEEE